MGLDWKEILHLLYIAKKYDVSWIMSVCRRTALGWIHVDNVLSVYENLRGLGEKDELTKETFKFIAKSVHFIYIQNYITF